MSVQAGVQEHARDTRISLALTDTVLEGVLVMPEQVRGWVILAQNGNSSHPRNRHLAGILADADFTSLRLDLLTQKEQMAGHLRFDISLLAKRLQAVLEWGQQHPELRQMPVGLCTFSTATAAALDVVTRYPAAVSALVSMSGRPDLLSANVLAQVQVPTLYILGGTDQPGICLNESVMPRMVCERELIILPEASHTFAEPYSLENLGERVRDWFQQHMPQETLIPAQRRAAFEGTEQASDGKRLTLALLGDVMLGRGVNEEIAHRSPDTFWGNTLPILKSVDGVIANLECAVTIHPQPWVRTSKVFHFRADPKAIDVLKAANIQCVSLANNHSLDYEEQGLLDTLTYLDQAEICHAGAGRNLIEAEMPAIRKINETTIGLLAFTDNEPSFSAHNQHSGTNYLDIDTHPSSLRLVEEAVTRAKQAGATFIILSLHWGPNMVQTPPEQFRAFARAAIDLGVHLIHGHSAHLFQGVEVYKHGLILYDTGDFLDDYAVDPVLRNDWSFIFIVEKGPERIEKLRMIPVALEYAETSLAVQEEFEAIRNKMRALCDALGTHVVNTPEGLELTL